MLKFKATGVHKCTYTSSPLKKKFVCIQTRINYHRMDSSMTLMELLIDYNGKKSEMENQT
mgnify:CR=1 FL=1